MKKKRHVNRLIEQVEESRFVHAQPWNARTSPYDKVAVGRTSLIKFIESRDDATLRGPVGASRCTAWITLICGFCAAPSTGLATKSRDVRARYLPRKCADDLARLYNTDFACRDFSRSLTIRRPANSLLGMFRV